MTKKILHKAILVIIAVMLLEPVLAQEKTVVKATADRTQILIGEPIKLSLEADIPENEPIRFFQLDSLPHFEFLAREKIDTSNTGSGTVLRQVLIITSFDSGHWVIPALPLSTEVSTDSIPVDIGFSPFDPQQPYHDIKEIIEVNPEEEKKQDDWWWYVAAGALGLLLILYFVFRKKKKPVVAVVAPPVDPYVEAMDNLEKLSKERAGSKEYYSALVDIFRVYVAKRKGIQSLQNTSEDLLRQLKVIDLDKTRFDSLDKALRLSDFVKFAKYMTTPEDDRQVFTVIKETIQSIEQVK